MRRLFAWRGKYTTVPRSDRGDLLVMVAPGGTLWRIADGTEPSVVAAESPLTVPPAGWTVGQPGGVQ